MRTTLIILLLWIAGTVRANDSLWLSLWRKAPVVVEAKIIETGGCIRMETTHCDIICVVTRYYKGHVAEGDTIRLNVRENDNVPLGGKFQTYDSLRYPVGKEFVFFLEVIDHNRFMKPVWYRPVDDWYGALKPTMALRTWLVNDIGDQR